MKVLHALFATAALSAVIGCTPSDPAANNAAAGNNAATNASDNSMNNASSSSNSSSNTASAPTQTPSGFVDPADRKPADGDEVAVVETTMGRIVLMFFPDKAPNHVANFKKLAKEKFYDGTKFHRVIPGFMIQGGDPNTKSGDRSSWGTGGPKESVNAEFNDVDHVRGVLSMARSANPNSAGSQFFVMHARAEFLNGKYTAFGKAISGLEVVDKIVAQKTEGEIVVEDKPASITSVTITKWPVK